MKTKMEEHWIRYAINWSRPLAKTYKNRIWGLFFLMLFSVALSLIRVNFIQRSIDAVQVGDVSALCHTALLFAGVTLLKLLYEYAYGCHYEKLFVHMERDLQNRFVQKLLQSQMREIDGENSGELSNKCSSDIREALEFIPAGNESKSCLHDLDDCREGRIPRPLGRFKFDAPLLAAGYLTRQGISNYLFQPLMLVGGFLYLFYFNHKLSLCVFLPIPIFAIFLNRMSGKASMFFGRIQGLQDAYSEQIFDAVHGAEIIRAGNMQKLQHDKTGRILDGILEESRQYNINIAVTLACIMAVTYVPMVSAFIYGAYLVTTGEIEVSLLFGYAQLINPVCMPVIDRMDFCLKRGECVGIVGESGAGKSTIMDLICGLYEADEGELKLFGQDSKMLALSDIREKIAYISQQAYLFPGTILENLRLADPDADEAQLWEALVKAGMGEYVCALPEGMQTVLSEKGDNLSGGQRQRFSLAQAFLRKAVIYMFDEPTASLDLDTEIKVMESIMTLVRNEKAASIIISHNVRALRDCDKVYRLKAGRLQRISKGETI